MLVFLCRNLRVNNSDTKAAVYKILVWLRISIGSIYCRRQRKIEMVQSRAAKYATNRYHNTSSVTDMLQDLDWESLESRRVILQLTLLFKVIQDLVDIPASAYLTPASTRTRANHAKKLFYQSQMPTSTVSSLEPSQFGILCRPLWPRPLTWYPSSRGSPLLHFKLA